MHKAEIYLTVSLQLIINTSVFKCHLVSSPLLFKESVHGVFLPFTVSIQCDMTTLVIVFTVNSVPGDKLFHSGLQPGAHLYNKYPKPRPQK